MYLIDTNVWLERLLDQSRSEYVARFLSSRPSSELCITDFTLHSIGVILGKLTRHEVFISFVRDTLIDGDVVLIRLHPEYCEKLVHVQTAYNLDFDDAYQDAYQYVSAETHDLVIVSFDSDFDKTERGKKSPEEILS